MSIVQIKIQVDEINGMVDPIVNDVSLVHDLSEFEVGLVKKCNPVRVCNPDGVTKFFDTLQPVR